MSGVRTGPLYFHGMAKGLGRRHAGMSLFFSVQGIGYLEYVTFDIEKSRAEQIRYPHVERHFQLDCGGQALSSMNWLVD